ncbi:MAG: DNA polymerase ligase N-terminal domain-containing protein [Thermoguttaceae bacterium]
MLRFALLIHDSPRGLHYDFFLEEGDVLKTWALPQLPEAGFEIPCEALANHRPVYLDYEGPISGDRGMVTRWDRGTYSVELWTDDEIIVEIAGAKLAGRVELRRQVDLPEQWWFNWQAGGLRSPGRRRTSAC